MAEFAGVSEQAFRRWMKLPGFPVAPDGSVCLWDLCLWRECLDRDDAEGAVDSPALEEWRRHRARLAELDVREREGGLLPLADVRELLLLTSSAYRGAGEQLLRRFGDEALEIVNHAIDEAESAALRRFGGPEIEPD